jgi:hypothetical protein
MSFQNNLMSFWGFLLPIQDEGSYDIPRPTTGFQVHRRAASIARGDKYTALAATLITVSNANASRSNESYLLFYPHSTEGTLDHIWQSRVSYLRELVANFVLRQINL